MVSSCRYKKKARYHSPLPGRGRFCDRNFLDEVTHARAFVSPQCGFSRSIFCNNPCTGPAPVSATKHNRLWWTHMHAMLVPLRSPAGSKRLVHLACAIGIFSWAGITRSARSPQVDVHVTELLQCRNDPYHKVDASKLDYANGKCLIWNGVPFVLRPLFNYSPHADHIAIWCTGSGSLAPWRWPAHT